MVLILLWGLQIHYTSHGSNGSLSHGTFIEDPWTMKSGVFNDFIVIVIVTTVIIHDNTHIGKTMDYMVNDD